MVFKCLHYNYNNITTCAGPYEQCAKQAECPNSEQHCFVVWQVENTLLKPISAGCNPYYTQAPPENCAAECIGQRKGQQRFYCCCTGNLCNSKYFLPTPKIESLGKPKEVDLENPHASNSVRWSVIPIVLLFIVIGTIFYWYRRKTTNPNSLNNINGRNVDMKSLGNQNRRNKGGSGNLNDRELNEIRQNNDTLIPFHTTLGGDPMLNNNNHNNFNHHHHHHHIHILNNTEYNPQSKATTNYNQDATDFNVRQLNGSNIDLNNIKLLEIIGSGKFGTVHRALLDKGNETSTEIAVKVISAHEHQSWMNEQQIYNSPKVKHPNILNFLYSDEHLQTESYWLVVEYASRGSLYSFLKENFVSWSEFLYIALGIVRGLSHLHEADIAHRDFKSKNVLLKHDLTPCVTDFGVAAILDTTSGSQMDHRKKYLQVGTPRYMAPEVLECSVTFTKASFTKIDVYALSLVLWELISRCNPLPKLDQTSEQSASAPTTPDEDQQVLLPPYKLPFEDQAGPNPDINKMRQIVVVEKLRPALRDEWRIYPASEFCRAIEDGWEYDHDARISTSCFVERVESLPANQLESVGLH